VHGDLSEFNILMAEDGPVIIDLPQAIDAAGNNHAQRMLMRDVGNLASYFGRFAPELRKTEYGPEIWSLYVAGALTVETRLTGHYEHKKGAVDLRAVMREIEATREEEDERVRRMSGD
jgi:RIO kinase 1